jgi:hypothetical protein
MKRLGSAALAAALLTSCGGPLLSLEVEIPDLRLTLPPQVFPAFNAPDPSSWCNPSAPQTDPPCVALSTSYDLAAHVPAFTQSGVTYELRLTDLAFVLSASQFGAGSPTDLSGIKSAAVRVGADPAVPGSGAVVATYTRTTVSPPPTTLAVTGNANLDLAPFVNAGQLPVRIEVVIDGGMSAFRADIQAAFYVRVTVDGGSYL